MKTIQLETEGYQPPKSGLVLLQCLVGLLFFTFVIRFWYLQIHRGADFAQQAQANHLRQESVYASRGLIRDVKGTLLAENRPAFGLALILSFPNSLIYSDCYQTLSQTFPYSFRW